MTAAVFIGDWEPGSQEWHAARQGGLGGSEIAAVLGLSPFESRFGLFHRKTGALGPVEEDEAMEWGRRLEDAIAGKFFDLHPEMAALTDRGMWHHKDRPWQIANPDRLVVHEDGPDDHRPTAVLECKFSLFGDGWGPAGTDQIPPHVRCQTMWYLDVFGLDVGYVVVFIGGGADYRTYRIEHDPTEAAELRQAGAVFLNEVRVGARPDIDDHTATYTAVKELHPGIDGQIVELPGHLACGFVAARRLLKGAEGTERRWRSELADHIGDAAKATFDGHTIARRQVRNGGTPYLVAARGLDDFDVGEIDITQPVAAASGGYEPLPGEDPF